MQINRYAEALREDLVGVAAVGDESTARAAELVSVALESAFARRLQGALELSSQLDHGRIEVRVAGADPQLVFVDDEAGARPETADEALTARITLRLPESLKSRLDAAAAASGMSVNTWLLQALTRLLEPRESAGGSRHRLTGYGRG
jgi:hypothetical protein